VLRIGETVTHEKPIAATHRGRSTQTGEGRDVDTVVRAHRSRASMTRDRSALDKLTEARAASSKCD
jgi:hypothetical protein